MLGVHSTVQSRHKTAVLYHLAGQKEASKSFNHSTKLWQRQTPIIYPARLWRCKKEKEGGKKKRKREKRLIINHSYQWFPPYRMIPTILGDKWAPWQPASRKGVLLYYHISTIQNLPSGPSHSVPTFCRKSVRREQSRTTVARPDAYIDVHAAKLESLSCLYCTVQYRPTYRQDA